MKAEDEMLRKNESPATRLLISMLIRYPEVSSVRYDPETKSLVFSFFVQGILDEQKQVDCHQSLATHLEICGSLDRKCASIGKLLFSPLDDMTWITYQQSIQLISAAELIILTHVLHTHFPEQVALDLLGIEHYDLEQQEEVIDRLLGLPETLGENKLVVAYREDGKVYVYNK